ncbi:unnamed protein product [Trichogramma brassicae]|uniref:Uncharacterized protein n=1 Tax=Trichogramma brassicae TaxID=86971 RepID=A0A6H5HYD1_9HYME|nr:unnamed protein product [Trichogramma brassicae]
MASQDRRMSFDRIHPNNRVEDDQSDDEVPSNDEESRSSPAASPERAHVNEAFESDEPQPLDPAPTLEGDGQHQEAGPSRRRSLIDEADNVSILTQRRGSNPVALQDRAANPDPPRRIQPAEEPERRLEPAEEPVRRFEPANEPPRRFQPAEEAERQGAEWDSPPPDYNEANKYNVNPPSYEFAVAARQIDPSHIRAPHEQQRARDVRVEMPAAAAPPPPRRPGRPSGQQLELFPTEVIIICHLIFRESKKCRNNKLMNELLFRFRAARPEFGFEHRATRETQLSAYCRRGLRRLTCSYRCFLVRISFTCPHDFVPSRT